nr:hypothetical protein [Saccharothrix yanglingensis]
MGVAGQGEVVQVGGAAVGPVLDVVGVAPLGWSVAVGEGAGPVAGVQRAALGGAHGSLGAAGVEYFGVAAEDDGEDCGVAGGAAGLGGAEVVVAVEHRVPDAPAEGVVVDGDADVRPFSGFGGQVARPRSQCDQVGERLTAPSCRVAGAVRVGCGEWFEQCGEPRAGLGGQFAEEFESSAGQVAQVQCVAGCGGGFVHFVHAVLFGAVANPVGELPHRFRFRRSRGLDQDLLRPLGQAQSDGSRQFGQVSVGEFSSTAPVTGCRGGSGWPVGLVEGRKRVACVVHRFTSRVSARTNRR